MLTNLLDSCDIILASASPRRKQLLSEMGLHFQVVPKDVDESLEAGVLPAQAAIELCELKARAFDPAEMHANTLIIAADTIVTIDGCILGKPADEKEAVAMLELLSGRKHEVITGVCIRAKHKSVSFVVSTQVYFKKLTAAEIQYYIAHYKPFDKAGAYGIQEWIGHVAIDKIEGSYFNVMGLPTHRLYEELCKFQM